MDRNDLKKEMYLATSKIMFFYFINDLINKNKAEINKENNNIINLDHGSSNWFVIGRAADKEELNNPFIGVQEDMIPWFFEMEWKRAVIDFERGHLYLSCAEIAEDSDFTIRLTVRKNRLNVFRGADDMVSGLDFRIFAFGEDNTITVSNKVYKRIYFRKFESQEDVVALHQNNALDYYNRKQMNEYSRTSPTPNNVEFFE